MNNHQLQQPTLQGSQLQFQQGTLQQQPTVSKATNPKKRLPVNRKSSQPSKKTKQLQADKAITSLGNPDKQAKYKLELTVKELLNKLDQSEYITQFQAICTACIDNLGTLSNITQALQTDDSAPQPEQTSDSPPQRETQRVMQEVIPVPTIHFTLQRKSVNRVYCEYCNKSYSKKK